MRIWHIVTLPLLMVFGCVAPVQQAVAEAPPEIGQSLKVPAKSGNWDRIDLRFEQDRPPIREENKGPIKLAQLQETGSARLGVTLGNLTAEEAALLGLSAPVGAKVEAVTKLSPAEEAGLLSGDIIVTMDGQQIQDKEAFKKALASRRPGTPIKLSVSRGGRIKTISVVLDKTATTEVVAQIGSTYVESVAFSRDGRFILASDNNMLKLWDVATGMELRSFSGHKNKVLSVAFSPDGRFVLSADRDASLKLWDVTTGKELRSLELLEASNDPDPISVGAISLSLSSDGKFALLSQFGGNGPKLWDLATGRQLSRFGRSAGATQAGLSSDGRFGFTDNGALNTLTLWDVATGKELRNFSGYGTDISYGIGAAISSDGRFVFGRGRSTLMLWDVATGKELLAFGRHKGGVRSVAISPDGRIGLSGSSDGVVKLWDIATGKELLSANGHVSGIDSVAFSPDGRLALLGGVNGLSLWEVATGAERWTTNRNKKRRMFAFSPDGRHALFKGSNTSVKLWDVAAGRELRSFGEHTDNVNTVVFSPDGRHALVVFTGSNTSVKLWDVAAGKELRSFIGHGRRPSSVAFSTDGRFALSGSLDKSMKLWDVSTGTELRSFSHGYEVYTVAFSPNDRLVLSSDRGGTIKLWDVATGAELRSFSSSIAGWGPAAFSPDGRFILSGRSVLGRGLRYEGGLRLLEIATGREVSAFAAQKESVSSVAFSPDGRFALSGGPEGLRLWDAKAGKELRSFKTDGDEITSIAFSSDSRFAFTCSTREGRIWDIRKGQELLRIMATEGGEWLAITPQGFFSSSHRDTELLALVHGLGVTTIGQVHQSLFNPDLVREALAGDLSGEVENAAKVVNLDKVLEAGPPPIVAITSHAAGNRSNAAVISVTAQVTDRGKGVGRIEWRVNGVTAGVTTAPGGAGTGHEVKRTLALDPGENHIEVIAYEGRNLLASAPARATIAYDGPADAVNPKLHILAVGINNYVDRGSAPAGDFGAFPPLNLAVADARTFATEMKKAAAGQYSEVHITEALDANATAASLDQIFTRVSAGINPGDTFVLYVAAHGFSKDGRFYLIPQDYQGGVNPDALSSRAISQERLQDWIANRVAAKKAIILLDTCESGALVASYAKSRTDAPASEATVGRLHEATGRPVLTAAASGKPAYEGYQGHGVFTFALLDSLRKGDSNANGTIELSEMVAHVQNLVPKLSAELSGRGVAAIAMRGFHDDKQSAHFGSTGEDFAIVRRLP